MMMTKYERIKEKLIELGYIYYNGTEHKAIFMKPYDVEYMQVIKIAHNDNLYAYCMPRIEKDLYTQKDLDTMQIVLNRANRDIKGANIYERV